MNRQRLQDRLNRKCNSLEKLYITQEKLAENPRARVEMDTGDGRVEYSNVNLKTLENNIHTLENGVDLIERKLGGTGIVSFNLRRHASVFRKRIV